MESIFGGLIEFSDRKSFINFLDNIDKERSINMLEMALEYGCKSGLFSIEENHIIYSCLNKIKENEESNISNNNHNGDFD